MKGTAHDGAESRDGEVSKCQDGEMRRIRRTRSRYAVEARRSERSG
jgi:hypothetical protein